MSRMNTVLGRRGYVIRKDSLSPEQLKKCKDELTYTIEDEYTKTMMKRPVAPEQFPIYAENANKIYLPRYYGLKEF